MLFRSSSKFLIFKDRVITENWTKPFQTGKIDITDWRTHTKNPLLTKVFREMNWAEELGSGQKKIRKYAPLYYEDTKINIQSGEEFIFSVTYRNPKDFEFEEKEGVIARGSTKSASSTTQVPPKYHLSTTQVHSLVKVMGNKCFSVVQIMDILKLKNRRYFTKEYLKPAVEEGFVALLYPNRPKSPKQKYCLTEKGKALCQEENVRPTE